jgi:biopolymer transport protein ExbD
MGKRNTDDSRGVNLSYIITPFLDMSFQLLAFFIMTYHPSALEGHIDGKLMPAAATGAPLALPATELPPISEPEMAETLLVQIKSVAKGQTEGNRHDGEPSRILLKDPQDTVTIAQGSDGTLDDGLKKLENELKHRLNQPGAIQSNIKIEGDGNLKHMYVMRVYDVCKLSGYANISFVAPKFGRQKAE